MTACATLQYSHSMINKSMQHAMTTVSFQFNSSMQIMPHSANGYTGSNEIRCHIIVDKLNHRSVMAREYNQYEQCLFNSHIGAISSTQQLLQHDSMCMCNLTIQSFHDRLKHAACMTTVSFQINLSSSTQVCK